MKKDRESNSSMRLDLAQGTLKTLSASIEQALINSKRWEWKWMGDHQEFTRLCTEFLHCDALNVMADVVSITAPLCMPAIVKIEEFLEREYTIKNDCARKLYDRALSAMTRSHLSKKRIEIGFQYGNSLRISDEETIPLPANGITFFEDSDGYRYILTFRDSTFTNSPKSYTLSLFVNREQPGVMHRIHRFFDLFEKNARETRIYRKGVINGEGQFVGVEATDWDDIALDEKTMGEIRFHIVNFFAHFRKMKKYNVHQNRGVILAGQPGNGKTLLGRILANTLNVPIVWLTANRVNEYFYNMGEGLDRLFKFANMIAPVILFIEDADIYLQSRMNPGANTRFLSELLNRLDGIKTNNGIMTVITANNPDLLDEAVKDRPKRFDAIIWFNNPGPAERKKILSNILTGHVRNGSDSWFAELSGFLDGFSSAHVTEFAERLIFTMVYAGVDTISEQMITTELARYNIVRNRRSKAGFVA